MSGKHKEDGNRRSEVVQENIPGLGEGSLHPCPDELTQVLLGKEISEAHKMCGFQCYGAQNSLIRQVCGVLRGKERNGCYNA